MCRITPEHQMRTKPYHCSLICDENEKKNLNVTCDDCAASKGRCKHALALLMWLYRRSEEPSTASVKCYWKTSKLSGVGTTLKMIKAKDVGPASKKIQVQPNKNDFFDKVVPKLRELQIQCSLSQYVCEKKEVEKVPLHYLINNFKKMNMDFDVESSLKFCKNEMTKSRCLQIKEATMAQSNSNLWFEMRYGRITASKMHEVAQCKAKDGSLPEEVFGTVTFKETAAIKRGKAL